LNRRYKKFFISPIFERYLKKRSFPLKYFDFNAAKIRATFSIKSARKIHAALVSNRIRFSRRSQNEEYENPVGSTAGLGNESIITLSLCILCFCHVSGISRPEYAAAFSATLRNCAQSRKLRKLCKLFN